ncbi:hypothetical protein WJX73_004478 [Symbiochloris irregularis]|uniref:VOC domain-containing protein n=1 Tax=Symbiochloris irregularis TaxID=706552 RepID=A0AAW1P8B1_9CHLO
MLTTVQQGLFRQSSGAAPAWPARHGTSNTCCPQPPLFACHPREDKAVRPRKSCLSAAAAQAPEAVAAHEQTKLEIHGLQHIGFLIENLERSMEFYQGILGLEVNEDRPNDKLPYRGAWLMVGPDMIHLMELPNPDPKQGRPNHGGQDRHICVGVPSIVPFVERLEAHNIPFTKSKSGRQALFFRDLDQNTLEVVEMAPWR